jgi:hypothetical protein
MVSLLGSSLKETDTDKHPMTLRHSATSVATSVDCQVCAHALDNLMCREDMRKIQGGEDAYDTLS